MTTHTARKRSNTCINLIYFQRDSTFTNQPLCTHWSNKKTRRWGGTGLRHTHRLGYYILRSSIITKWLPDFHICHCLNPLGVRVATSLRPCPCCSSSSAGSTHLRCCSTRRHHHHRCFHGIRRRHRFCWSCCGSDCCCCRDLEMQHWRMI